MRALQKRLTGAFQSQHLPWCVLGLLVFAPRLLDLGAFLDIDGCAYWLARSLKFYKALYNHDPGSTLIAAHPGVTLMILSGASMILAGLAKFDTLHLLSHRAELFYFAKLPIAVVTGVGVILLYCLFRKHYKDHRLPFLAAVFIALDPYFLAQSRYLQLDGLTSIFMLLSLVLLSIYSQRREKYYLVGSGLCAGLAFLSKVYALSLIPFAIVVIAIAGYHRAASPGAFVLRIGADVFCWSLAVAGVLVLLWPAMWVEPIASLQRIVLGAAHGMTRAYQNGGSLVEGVRWVPDQIAERGLKFDPKLLGEFFARSSLFILSLGAISIALLIKRRGNETTQLVVMLALFFVYFMGGMSFAGLGSVRYCVIGFQICDVMAAYAFSSLLSYVETVSEVGTRMRCASLAVVYAPLVLYAGSVLSLHPYYQAFHNEVFRPRWSVGWGDGLEQVGAYLSGKPNSEGLVVASMYPCVLGTFFRGRIVDLGVVDPHDARYQTADPDYVVLYVSQVARYRYAGVVDEYYLNTKPEFVVRLGDIEYAWVYRRKQTTGVSHRTP